MFLRYLNNDEKVVFLNLVAYSSTLARMSPKDEDEIKKQDLAVANNMLDYMCELDFISKDYITAKRWSSSISYCRNDEFYSLFRENENFSNLNYSYDAFDYLMVNCAWFSMDEDYENLYNLPKELKFVVNKELFYLEVLNFYENISFICTCKDEFLDQIRYFLRLSDDDLKNISEQLLLINAKKEAISEAKKDLENQKYEVLGNFSHEEYEEDDKKL